MHYPRLTKNDPPADVVLLLEGTYPMVQGGVAGWVEQLIKGLPIGDLPWCLSVAARKTMRK